MVNLHGSKYVGQAIIVNDHDAASGLKLLRSAAWWEVGEKKANSAIQIAEEI